MESFAKYLAEFDGSAEWSKVRPLFEEVFHPDCVFLTADGELNTEQWAEMAKGLTERAAVVSGFEVTDEQDDTIFYQLTLAVGDDEPLQMTAKGTLLDGRLIRVEPVDPAVYSTMVERSR